MKSRKYEAIWDLRKGFIFRLRGSVGKREIWKKVMEMLFYKQPEIFDDYCQVFDEKLVTYKINSKF